MFSFQGKKFLDIQISFDYFWSSIQPWEATLQIQFFGAARSVTGSMHLLTIDGKKILLDCGLFQGRRQETFERNSSFPFDPASIDTLILSHAHIDHSGNIPNLVKHGFAGNIFCTHATRDLCSIMLRDSGHIQEKDTEFVNKKHARRGLPPVQPLYTIKDAERSLQQFVSISYRRTLHVNGSVKVTFYDAGHILGSALTLLEISENGKNKNLLFTGDLGRKGLPILCDPHPLDTADILITESTYGGRCHDDLLTLDDKLAQVVNEAYNRGGKIIVPAFSVGRTQEVVYALQRLIEATKIPEIPIFVDSPLSVNATEVFRAHPECFDEETSEYLLNHQDPFGFGRVRYIKSLEESKKLNRYKKPCMIISASGMCETGRIVHHLRNNIGNPKNTVLIVGFMAEHTLGRRLVEKQPIIRIFGEEHHLRAQVVKLNAFSAHADHDELLEYIGRFDRERLKYFFVVHGETGQAEALAQAVGSLGIAGIHVPEREQAFVIE
jgi:metallo-beta-lactamase family protein